MIKSILASSMLCAALLFSGCGDSEGEDRLETQQMLDDGDYAAVIAKLEGSASSIEEYLALAAAYMQRAGLGLADLITVVSDSGEEDSDAFTAFVKSVSAQTSSTALNDLGDATRNYGYVVNDCANDALSDSQKDVCLYIGLAETMKAATTIGYLTEDITLFGADSNGTDAKLQTAACAMQYAYDGNDGNCTISSNGNITFIPSAKTYESIDVTYDAQTFEYLLYDTNVTTTNVAMTKGYCTLDSFTTRTLDINDTNSSYHVCPINESATEDDLTSEQLIVDALNGGFDAISGVATDDMQGDIDEFKCEVLGGTYNGSSCSADLDQNVTAQQVIDYLNANN